MSTQDSCSKDDELPLPGFRFHPTDEELVGFYLRRKIEKKPLKIELIKQIDIYKYDPWDLPKTSSVGDSESYFFCKRGRKYRNSVRPNRVTGSGSGFWKATGIDKPVYSHGGEGHDCIGLKKTLVYYRGSAGKGTKTDWMMHEFRLPPNDNSGTSVNFANSKSCTQEAEVWTLCRIFKRTVSSRKYTPDWRELATKRQHHPVDTSSRACNLDPNDREAYINFAAPMIHHCNEEKPVINHLIHERNLFHADQLSYVAAQPPSVVASSSSFSNPDDQNEFFRYAHWDELRPVVEFALDPSLL